MLLVVKNLIKRNGNYSYRKVVPKDLRDIIDKTEWTVSLSGMNNAQAIAAAEKYNERYKQQIDACRNAPDDVRQLKKFAERYVTDHPELLDTSLAGAPSSNLSVQDLAIEALLGDYDGIPSDPKNIPPEGKPAPANIQAILRTVQNNGQYVPETNRLSSIFEHYKKSIGKVNGSAKYAFIQFTDFNGDKELKAIRRMDVADWIAKCRKTQSDATIRRRLNDLSAMVNKYRRDFELTAISNPFAEHGIKNTHTGDEKLPFNRQHLKAIDSYLKSSKVSARNKAILCLMKHTGAIGSELAFLEQRDVILDGPVPYIWIRLNDARKQVKAEARARKIPLLPIAKKAIAPFKKDGSSALIWGKKINPDTLSAALNKAIRNAIPTSPRLTVYSYRHALKEAMRAAGVAQHLQHAILGHKDGSVAEKYGANQQQLKILLAVLKKAKPKLGDVDDANYTEDELTSP